MKTAPRVAAALGAAALLALGQPARLFWPATLAGLCLFLLALRGATPRPAIWLGTATGVLLCALTVPWFFHVFPGAAPFALFVMFGLFHGLFAGVTAWIAPRIRPAWLRALWIAAWWIAVEYYRSEWFVLRYPWITPGVALGPTWLTPLLGVYGQGFLAVLGASLLTSALPDSAGGARPGGRPAWAGLALALLLSALAYFRPPPVEPGDPVRVALVQCEDSDFDRQFALTLSATNAPQLVAWPETALFGDLRTENRRLLARLSAHAAASNTLFTVGCYSTFGDGPLDWFNTALTFDGAGMLGEHHKCRPVHLFNDGRRGTNAVAVGTPLGRMGTPICFDCDYTEITRRMARDGAEFFAVPSRDPSPWGDRQRAQHAMLFRLRAAECGRWFAVASAAGITQIVDPHGNVRASLPPYAPGILCGTVGREQAQTGYVALGWLLPWFLTAASLAGLVAVLATRPPGKP